MSAATCGSAVMGCAPFWRSAPPRMSLRSCGLRSGPLIPHGRDARQRSSGCGLMHLQGLGILLEQRDPLACEFRRDAENVERRPDRRKPLGEFESKLHIGQRHIQKLGLISLQVRGGRRKIKPPVRSAIRHGRFEVILKGCRRFLDKRGRLKCCCRNPDTRSRLFGTVMSLGRRFSRAFLNHAPRAEFWASDDSPLGPLGLRRDFGGAGVL
jgi:hypothetical protein